MTENITLRSAQRLREMWTKPGAIHQYYPPTHTSFWIECQLWGLWPVGYHAVNILLHALGAVLLWKCLLLLGVPGSFWVALLFAVHPVQVESVAWITERKNALSSVFYFGAFAAYWRWHAAERRPAWYALALVLFICALRT